MVPFALPEPLSEKVHAFAKARGATVFMVLLAAYEALLSRYSGQEDFAVGSPVAGRDRREIEGLIGFFVNTLALRSSLPGEPGIAKLLDRVRTAVLEGYARQSVPFERIVQDLAPERNLSHSPLFQVMLAFQSLGAESLELPGLTLAPQGDEFPVSKFDLTLTAFDSERRRSSDSGCTARRCSTGRRSSAGPATSRCCWRGWWRIPPSGSRSCRC